MNTTEPDLKSTPRFGPVNMHEIAKKHVVIVPSEICKRMGWDENVKFMVEVVDGGALLYKPVRSEA